MTKYTTFRIGKGLISFLIDKKAFIVFLSLLAAAAGLFITSIGMGDVKIGPLQVVKALFSLAPYLNRITSRHIFGGCRGNFARYYS
jgi:hypothetical protein